MNILGIHDGHNATVALFQNDRITHVLSEERLSRKKNEGGFPKLALNRILQESALDPSQVTKVIFTTKRPHAEEWFEREKLLHRYREIFALHQTGTDRSVTLVLRLLRHVTLGKKKKTSCTDDAQRHAIRCEPLLVRGFLQTQIGVMDHHTSHAISAYFANHDFDHDVLALTNDGGGDGVCASVSVGRAGHLERVATVPVRDSFAALYARATFLMGMMPLEHEYKLMGLAPYADQKRAEPLAQQLLSYFEWPADEPLNWHLADQFISANYLGGHLKDVFYLQRFDVVAAAMQMFVERMTLRWVRQCIQHTNIRHLVLAGGLFMNVKLNQKILELPEVESLYVIPSCGDESTPLGACYDGAVRAGQPPQAIQPLRDLYLGPTYAEDDIKRAIQEMPSHRNVAVELMSSIPDVVSALLCQGNIVALYQGREEFGARALGHRSLLADPSQSGVIRQLNKMITFEVKRHYHDFAAATHPYDETTRTQVLLQEWDQTYYQIIEHFEQKSGKRGGVLNTSFNLHGYPIVSSPKDALEVFFKSGLQYLALGDYLISKTTSCDETH